MTPYDSLENTLADTQALNTLQIADLADGATDAQRAQHIRGLVAVTMAHVPADASGPARASAAQWQSWALGVARALEPSSPEPSGTAV